MTRDKRQHAGDGTANGYLSTESTRKQPEASSGGSNNLWTRLHSRACYPIPDSLGSPFLNGSDGTEQAHGIVPPDNKLGRRHTWDLDWLHEHTSPSTRHARRPAFRRGWRAIRPPSRPGPGAVPAGPPADGPAEDGLGPRAAPRSYRRRMACPPGGPGALRTGRPPLRR